MTNLDASDYAKIRFIKAGELLCAKRGFESGLMECTMVFPNVSQYLELANTIPNFIESYINSHIAAIQGFLKYSSFSTEKFKEYIKQLIDLLELKMKGKKYCYLW